MTHDGPDPHQEGGSEGAMSLIAIDPKEFFLYAVAGERRWQELTGLDISHCLWGTGTISKVEGSYVYVDLPERPGKKQLSEFCPESFRMGYFHNLLVSNALQQKMIEAAIVQEAQIRQLALEQEEARKKPAPKKRAPRKATKKTI
jgi:hypothetical protein